MGASMSIPAPTVRAEASMAGPHLAGGSPPPGCPMHQEQPKSEFCAICYLECYDITCGFNV